jgi:hypothetical protein
VARNKVYTKLREPFPLKFISWKINNYSQDKLKALITFHIDARAVQHRLNEVVGVDGWSFSFTELEKDNGVHGCLTLFFDDGGSEKEEQNVRDITREDVGYANRTDKSEWYKDAVSDALKRCAVHFGVGHFLYALPTLWVDLSEPGQKYLGDDQNRFILAWLQEQISKMTKKVPD